MAAVGDRMINAQIGTSAQDGALRPPGVPPSTGVGGPTQNDILADLIRRFSDLERKVELKVDGDRVTSAIVLNRSGVLIQGDQIGVAGTATFADWLRDVNGQATGVISPSLTQIRGGVIRTEKILNFNGTAWVDLDATGSAAFLQCGSAVSIRANGTFQFGDPAASKTVVFDGTNLSVGSNALIAGTAASTVVINANFGATRSVGDITAQVLANSATSITMASSQLFKTTNGLGGVFIGAGGIFAKNNLGQNTLALDGATGDVSFAGNIDTGGKGVFRGSQLSPDGAFTAAIHGNTTGAARCGVMGYSLASNGKGVFGRDTAGGVGVHGDSNSGGYGVYATAQGGGSRALVCEGISGATALQVGGPMVIFDSTQVANLNASFLRGHGGAIITLLGATTSSGSVIGYINVMTIDGQIGKLPLMS